MVRFDIPPQDLDTAMTRLADQAGIRLLGASSDLAGKRTAGLSGDYTIAQALNALLAGSGVGWRFSEANTVVLERLAPASGAVQLDPVRVQAGVPPQAVLDNLPPAYAGGQVAKGAQVGFLGERDFMDTPFNQSAYTSTLIQNQQARSIADVAANDPSVRNAWPAVGYSTALMIRGFSFNSNDMSFGGLYGIAPTLLVAPDYLERVEILKGPGAMLNGMPPFGSVGGAVNLVPKRAQGELNRATASYATAGQFGGTTDVARRFGDGEAWGVRFNGIYHNGSTQVDRQTQAVGAAVFGLDYRGDRLRAAVDYGYQSQATNSPLRATYVAAGVPVPLAPGGTANWFQPWTFQQNTDLFGTARVEYDVTPDWTVYGAVGGRRSLFNALTGFATVTSANGNLTENPLNFPGLVAGQHRGGRRAWPRRHRPDPPRALAQRHARDAGGRPALPGSDDHLVEPLPADLHRQAQRRDPQSAQDQLHRTLDARHRRRHLGVRRAHPVHRRRSPSARPGRQLQPDLGRGDLVLRPERVLACRRLHRQAAEQPVRVRQLHPGPAAGADRTPRHAQLRRRSSRRRRPSSSRSAPSSISAISPRPSACSRSIGPSASPIRRRRSSVSAARSATRAWNG